MEQQYTLSLVIKALDEFSKTFATLNSQLGNTAKAQGKTTTATATATAGLNQFKNVLGQVTSGNFVGAFQSLAGAIPGVGIAAVAVTGIIVTLGAALNKQVEEVRTTINAVDELADRYNLTMRQANQLHYVTKIFNIDANTLGRTFRTMGRQDLPPTVQGLIEAKKRIEAVQDPTERLQLTFKLFGRGALLMADMLKASSTELQLWADRAEYLGSVTEIMTKEQDDFSRSQAYFTSSTKNANVAMFKSTLTMKQQVQLWFAEHTAMGRVNVALQSLGLNLDEATLDLDTMNKMLYAATQLQVAGIPVTEAMTNAWIASEDAVQRATEGQDEIAARMLITEEAARRLNLPVQDFIQRAPTAALAWNEALDGVDTNLAGSIESWLSQFNILNIGIKTTQDTFALLRGAAAQGMDPKQVEDYAAGLEGVALAQEALAGEMTKGEALKAARDLGVPIQDMYNYLALSKEELQGLAQKWKVQIAVKASGDTWALRFLISNGTSGQSKADTYEKTTEARNQAFGDSNLLGGIYNVGEAGTEGLIVRGGRISIIPHHKWLASGMGAGRPGFMEGGDLNTGSLNTNIAYAGLTQNQIDYMTGDGGGGKKTKAVQQVAAAVQQASTQAAAVAAQVVAAAVPSSAAIGQAVTAPVLAASARAEQASKDNSALLGQILSVLRGQGTAADAGRNMREAIITQGQ